MNANPKPLIPTHKLLSELPKGVAAKVVGFQELSAPLHQLRRLAELGFLRGEAVKVLRRVAGGEPVAVRVGNSTFALRKHEAECIKVEILPT
jgi:ferrous iron transport protein A